MCMFCRECTCYVRRISSGTARDNGVDLWRMKTTPADDRDKGATDRLLLPSAPGAAKWSGGP